MHDADSWKAAFYAAGAGTHNVDIHVVRKLRKLVWLQTENAIKLVLAERLDEVPITFVFGRALRRTVASQLKVGVVCKDLLLVATEFAAAGHKVAVLSMANPCRPGGDFKEGAGAQEENLHRRTDLCRHTAQQRHNYPIPHAGCLVSERVTIFRGEESEGYPFLAPEHMQQVCVISSAALKHPRLNEDRDCYAREADHELMKLKVVSMLQAAANRGCDTMVLSAFGCGAYKNPPRLVAAIFKEVLLTSSPVERVVFAVMDDHNAHQQHNPEGNWCAFVEVFGEWKHDIPESPSSTFACACHCGRPRRTPAAQSRGQLD
jgi:uncharacterized protein (TIGR02452 family)